MGGENRLALLDLGVDADKIIYEVQQLELKKGDYLLIRVPREIIEAGRLLHDDINNAFPGIFVTLTYSDVILDVIRKPERENKDGQ